MIGTIGKMIPMVALLAAMGGGSEELTKIGQEMINLVQEFRTRAEMAGLVKVIRLDILDQKRIPRDIVKYARDNIDSQGADSGLDIWGVKWKTDGSQRRPPFFIVSCGPDTKCGTDDDIYVQVIDKDGRFQSQVE